MLQNHKTSIVNGTSKHYALIFSKMISSKAEFVLTYLNSFDLLSLIDIIVKSKML